MQFCRSNLKNPPNRGWDVQSKPSPKFHGSSCHCWNLQWPKASASDNKIAQTNWRGSKFIFFCLFCWSMRLAMQKLLLSQLVFLNNIWTRKVFVDIGMCWRWALCRTTLEKTCSSWPCHKENCHQKSDTLKLWIWVLFFAFCLQWINVLMNGRYILETTQKIKPKIQKFGWMKFWPPFFVQSRGNELWCSTVPFHTTSCDHCAWYPISAIRSLLGRRNPFDLLGLAHCRVLQLTTPQESRRIVEVLFGSTTWKERCDTCPRPVCFGGCCLENSSYLKMWPEEFN